MASKLKILLEIDDKGKVKIDGVTRSVKDLDKSLYSVTSTAKLLKGALLGTIAVLGISKIKSAASAWIDLSAAQQLAERELKAAAISVEKYSGTFHKGMLQMAKDMERYSGYTDQAILRGMKYLVVAEGITESLMPKVSKVMLDFARFTGMETEGAAKLLVKASMGMQGELRRLGVVVGASTYTMKGFAGVLEEISVMVGGQTAMYTGSYKYAWDTINIATKEGKERLGDFFNILLTESGIVEKFTNKIWSMVDAFDEMEKSGEISSFASNLIVGMTEWGIVALEVIQSVYDGFKLLFKDLSQDFKQLRGDLQIFIDDYKAASNLVKSFMPKDQQETEFIPKGGWGSSLTGLKGVNAGPAFTQPGVLRKVGESVPSPGEIYEAIPDILRNIGEAVPSPKEIEDAIIKFLKWNWSISEAHAAVLPEDGSYNMTSYPSYLAPTIPSEAMGIDLDVWLNAAPTIKKVTDEVDWFTKQINKAKETLKGLGDDARITLRLIASGIDPMGRYKAFYPEGESYKNSVGDAEAWRGSFASRAIGGQIGQYGLMDMPSTQLSFAEQWKLDEKKFKEEIKLAKKAEEEKIKEFEKLWTSGIMAIVKDGKKGFDELTKGLADSFMQNFISENISPGIAKFMGGKIGSSDTTWGEVAGAGSMAYGMYQQGQSGNLSIGEGMMQGGVAGSPWGAPGAIVGGFAGGIYAAMSSRNNDDTEEKISLLWEMIDGKLELVTESWENAAESSNAIYAAKKTVENIDNIFTKITGELDDALKISVDDISQSALQIDSSQIARIAKGFPYLYEKYGEEFLKKLQKEMGTAMPESGSSKIRKAFTFSSLNDLQMLMENFNTEITKTFDYTTKRAITDLENFKSGWGDRTETATAHGEWGSGAEIFAISLPEAFVTELTDPLMQLAQNFEEMLSSAITGGMLAALQSGDFQTFKDSFGASIFETMATSITQSFAAKLIDEMIPELMNTSDYIDKIGETIWKDVDPRARVHYTGNEIMDAEHPGQTGRIYTADDAMKDITTSFENMDMEGFYEIMEGLFESLYGWIPDFSNTMEMNTDALTKNTDALIGPLDALLNDLNLGDLATGKSWEAIQDAAEGAMNLALKDSSYIPEAVKWARLYLEEGKGASSNYEKTRNLIEAWALAQKESVETGVPSTLEIDINMDNVIIKKLFIDGLKMDADYGLAIREAVANG
uniref:Putative tail tape measure protein n=1 Tax=viral metagenome TaxID=1070528 RepID=A0A6M3IP19_9ZZZZ